MKIMVACTTLVVDNAMESNFSRLLVVWFLDLLALGS